MKKKHRLPFSVLFEDDDLIVIDKPAGLLTTHTKLAGRAAREGQFTAENILNDYVRKGQLKSRKRVWLVHRLDRDTSGVMMFAKSEAVAEKFRADWANLTEKTYLARVEGIIAEESGVFESHLLEDPDGYRVRSIKVNLGSISQSSNPPIRQSVNPPIRQSVNPPIRQPRYARTEWRRLSVKSGTTLVEVKLKTGRKNQIRVHFSEAGHPVVGDVKYGGRRADRLHLHAKSLRFRHPRTGEWLEFSSPLILV
jgi:tRNA pseudouridine32 synthase/23S rRNA pseudouridine746 synthase/23S rRNA pseudouridine1911/1915/1917 synthase